MCRCIVGWLRLRLGLTGRAREVTLRLGELRVIVDSSRHEIFPYWELWHEDVYELLPQFRATEDACVVDVGGNVGFYAIRQALRAKRGRVLTFEPSPTVFHRLQRNIEAHHQKLANVTAVNLAIGDASGTVPLFESPMSIHSRVETGKTDQTIDVPCRRLDTVLESFGVERVNILKIDTEGYERAVLFGGTSILPKTERIVLEMHERSAQDKRVIDAMLRRFGFHEVAQNHRVFYYERATAR